jgi:CIC family chloride channel protein
MIKESKLFQQFLIWRNKNIDQRTFVLLLSLIVGLISGMAGIVLKNTVFYTHFLLTRGFTTNGGNILYLVYPLIGIFFTVIYVRLFVKDKIGHGITRVLFAISQNNSHIKSHNNYSSMIASTITVAFGGSVGLEAPVVTTGASIGSNLGRLFNMDYRTLTLLIGCGATGAIAGIFKAPIAAIIFTLEVLMLDLTMASLIPLLISAVAAASLSYFFMGKDVLFQYAASFPFQLKNIPFYVLLGIICGFVSLYFNRTNAFIESKFGNITNITKRLVIGGLGVSLMVYLFPPLYGEGYDTLANILNGKGMDIVTGSHFYSWKNDIFLYLGFILMILVFKVIAMSFTTGAGGVGGVFAPSLFMGGITGFALTKIFNSFTLLKLPESNFTLAGMAGVMAGVMQAPLTSSFLIAEITGGYQFFVPIMITATISYLTIHYFEPHGIYTKRLASKNQLITHNKDKAVLTRLKIDKLIETNFSTVSPDATLADLVKVVSQSQRNVFPVVDANNYFHGVVFINDIRHIIFKTEMYDNTYVRNLMFMPDTKVEMGETMEDVAQKFNDTQHYNLPVLQDGKYIGFVSRANVFSSYRKLLKEFSAE